ncbi:MAG: hypothetical protein ACE3JP_09955 [Ectobacillus sp.]
MKIVVFFHTIIWIGFSLVLWLSERDNLHAKIVMFFVFLYLAYVVAHTILQKRCYAAIVTAWNSCLFIIIKMAISWIV